MELAHGNAQEGCTHTPTHTSTRADGDSATGRSDRHGSTCSTRRKALPAWAETECREQGAKVVELGVTATLACCLPRDPQAGWR